MASLLQKHNAAMDTDLVTRFIAAVRAGAYAVAVESAGTANHAERLTWAKAAIASSTTAKHYAEQMLILALERDGTFADACMTPATVTDAAITTQVTALITPVAVNFPPQ